ncbi:MAG: fluoride efflux transporter CrcB [Candidatus Omnitrophica bacterium]|nr:fluoride efflux transporter CrcB [Candidatus Omnitrophota bacterium]
MVKIILIGIGGAIGSILRYIASGLDYRYSYGIFPISTLVVNLAGSFIIGFLWGMFEATTVSSNIRMFIFIGILGGFTTFSTFALENFNLFRDGERSIALINIVLSNILGIFLVYIGYMLAKMLLNFMR